MSRETDNETFVRTVQKWLGIKSDGWAGSNTFDAWVARNGAPIVQKRSLKYPSAFFAVVRDKWGTLTKEQVQGYEFLLKAMGAWSIYDVAYGLATAFWETNKTMQPVAEAYYLGAKAEAWRKKNLRYYPWYGRGYPQTTWEVNYKRADDELGLNGTLLANPDRMLEPEIAAATMVRGMEEGWFTGKKNSDYSGRQYVARRKMINGTDHDDEIAAVAEVMEAGLLAGEWS